MSTTPYSFDQARAAIAEEIGADAVEFTAPGDKNFIAAITLYSMAGSFLYAFLKVVASKAVGHVEDRLGESLGDAFLDLLDRLRHKQAPATDADLQAARSEAVTAIGSQNLSKDQIAEINHVVADAMGAFLAKHADSDVANRVTACVGQQAMQAIIG
jgi:hypothetical protein